MDNSDVLQKGLNRNNFASGFGRRFSSQARIEITGASPLRRIRIVPVAILVLDLLRLSAYTRVRDVAGYFNAAIA